MELAENVIINQESKLGNVTALLFVLQNMLQDILEEVERSYELHKIGEKTDLLKQLEDVLQNPSSNVFRMSAQIDSQVRNLIDKSVKAFFFKMGDKIDSAVRSKTAMNDLHYSIALLEDNEVNRASVFNFLDRYDLLDISARYPVYFQFVPVRLMSKINVQEQILPKVAA